MSRPAAEKRQISQRDLRMRSREIMDAVERGESFTVTRQGHQIGELVPLRPAARFVSRDDFAAASRGLPAIDLERFRSDQERFADGELEDPYGR